MLSPVQVSIEAHRISIYKITITCTIEVFMVFAIVVFLTQDINDNVPVFESSNYREVISETTLGNVFVLTVKAKDKDSPTTGAGIIDYSIEVGASGKFVINGTTGVITTSLDATFDYDLVRMYNMTVSISSENNTHTHTHPVF